MSRSVVACRSAARTIEQSCREQAAHETELAEVRPQEAGGGGELQSQPEAACWPGVTVSPGHVAFSARRTMANLSPWRQPCAFAIVDEEQAGAEPPTSCPSAECRNMLVRGLSTLHTFWMHPGTSMALYVAFVLVFQRLIDSIRMKEEYLIDKHIAETFLWNHFDANHNTFETIRRVADIYEWGNNVLWPGLFSNAGPCGASVGAEGHFRSAVATQGPTNLTAAMEAKGCNDDAWADGAGTFHLHGATGRTVAEHAALMDETDWSEGLSIRSSRVRQSSACHTELLSGVCLPEMKATEMSDTSPFGFNWTDHGQPLAHPWRYKSAAQLGANPRGQMSAHLASFRTFEGGGFVAFVIPFFSSAWLPEQKGDHTQVIDYRLTRLGRTSSSPTRVEALRNGSYFCVRLSWNGERIHQLCDPGDAEGRTTGVVRAACEEFWNDLKRGHFIDAQTRSVLLTLPLRSNHMGARTRVSLLFETTSLGAVLSSYDMETRVESSVKVADTAWWVDVALAMSAGFLLLELLEMTREGVAAYFRDAWNLMDWINLGIFGMVYFYVGRLLDYSDQRECDSEVCQRIGWHDDWQVMTTARTAKTWLSLCVCIQLLKVLKFSNDFIPKMGLATAVLSKGLPDLFFFGLVFAITMVAFCMMFYVQLGAVMVDYHDPLSSFFSLSRALFGDFDIEDILANSQGYLNSMLFLVYLFVAVFIMLSMFLAILGESQALVRRDQDRQRATGTAEPEYGVFTRLIRLLKRARRHLKKRLQRLHRASSPHKGKAEPGDDDETEAEEMHAPSLPTQIVNLAAQLDAMAAQQRLIAEAVLPATGPLKASLTTRLEALEATVSRRHGDPQRQQLQHAAQHSRRGVSPLALGGSNRSGGGPSTGGRRGPASTMQADLPQPASTERHTSERRAARSMHGAGADGDVASKQLKMPPLLDVCVGEKRGIKFAAVDDEARVGRGRDDDGELHARREDEGRNHEERAARAGRTEPAFTSREHRQTHRHDKAAGTSCGHGLERSRGGRSGCTERPASTRRRGHAIHTAGSDLRQQDGEALPSADEMTC